VNVLVWTVNGVLVSLFFLADHLSSIGLLLSCGYFAFSSPNEQRTWSIGVGVAALAASMFAPSPIPLLMFALSLSGWGILAVEQYSRSSRRWDILTGLGLYCGVAILYLGYYLFAKKQLDANMGAGYINAIVTILVYVWPVGTLAIWAQQIFAHQPGLGKPEDVIAKVRTRGK
jgi:hypothetical protein